MENRSALSIEQIMQGDDFVGHLPESIRWSADSKTVYFDWNPDMDTLDHTYKVQIGTTKVSKLSLDELRQLPDYGLRFNEDESQYLYLKDGDIYLEDVEKKRSRIVTNTVEEEESAFFTTDNRIIFRQGKNLFSWSIDKGELRQLTNFKKGGKASKAKGSKPD